MANLGELLVTLLPNDRECVTKWSEVAEFSEKFGPSGEWIFRGVNNSSYSLQTSFERVVLALALDKKNPSKDDQRSVLAGTFGAAKKTVFDFEGGLMRTFRRRCHHYIDRSPETPIELLSLMQHYEAPTRLLDWTYSFYVALFFAVDRADIQKSEHSAIWALNTTWIVEQFKTRYSDLHDVLDVDRNMQRNLDTFKQVFRKEKKFVCPVNPYFLNERQSIQQGVFLCPGAVNYPFEDNLAALQYQELDGIRTPVMNAAKALVKIKISNAPSKKKEILQHLHRMNMSRASLFPGIDGFARSLENILAFPDILEYGEKYENDFSI